MTRETAHQRILRSGATMSEKMANGPAVFVAENRASYERVRRYPELVNDEGRIKYDPFTGFLYLDSWRSAEDSQILLNGDRQEIIGERGKNGHVGKIRWSELPHIERAMRQAEHIAEKYEIQNGESVVQIKNVVAASVNLLGDFRHGIMGPGVLHARYGEIVDMFETNGFFRSTKYDKKRLVVKLVGASSPDRLGRYNPLISRTLAASALIGTTRELLLAREIRNKSNDLFTIMNVERATERMRLKQADELLLASQAPFFEKDAIPSHSDLEQVVRTARSVNLALLSPKIIKAAPYRTATTTASYTLFADLFTSPQEQPFYRNMVRSLTTPEVFDWQLKPLSPISEVLRHYRESPTTIANEIKNRLINSKLMVENALKTGDLNRTPWTDTTYTPEEHAAKWRKYGGIYDDSNMLE